MKVSHEFIPYEQALELKELGFDEECLKYWVLVSDRYELFKDKLTNDDAPAPLYQQAFRWFREKYDLTGLIHIGTHEFSFSVNKNGSRITPLKEYLDYNGTYEEAELACLKKLIEIVKNK
jgi:hypothetical protein